MLKIAYSPIYKYKLPEGHRFPMEKYELVPEQLLYEGTVTNQNFFHPPQLADHEILLTHTKEYLEKMKNQSFTKKEIRSIGFPMTPNLIERGRHIAMGTYQCALFAKEYGVSMNIAGGTHHSFADHGEGFCIYNDMAIASNMLLNEKKVNKILIIDLDVHQGNGTASIFEKEDQVFTFSMHGAKNYPHRKMKSDKDIGLPDKIEGNQYLKILQETLPKLLDQVQPDFVFYLSGVDILESDKLGRLSVSREDCKSRDEFVLSQCKNNSIPVAIAMGGGYSPDIKDIVEAHSNTFRVAQDIYF